jgi:hypothetical protein
LSQTDHPDFFPPKKISGKWYLKLRSQTSKNFKIMVSSGDARYISSTKRLNKCKGATSTILDGTTYAVINQAPASITSTITSTVTFTKYKGTCDASVSCQYLSTKPAYEKEYFFFNKFTMSSSECGEKLTYTLKDHPSGTNTQASVAILDEIPLVPGKKRINLKSAATAGTKQFKIVVSNQFGATKTSSIVTINIAAFTE